MKIENKEIVKFSELKRNQWRPPRGQILHLEEDMNSENK